MSTFQRVNLSLTEAGHDVRTHLFDLEKILMLVTSRLAQFPHFFGGRNTTFQSVYLNHSHLCWVGTIVGTELHVGEKIVVEWNGMPLQWLLRPFYASVFVFGCAKALRGVSRATLES